ncbi:heterokaryon incompatibility protein-domain-containing protein [Nemania sp. FL0916]|nr:heterokaryon incompatibility protein-domain-containing protein [Nemania sp. FL0916]
MSDASHLKSFRELVFSGTPGSVLEFIEGSVEFPTPPEGSDPNNSNAMRLWTIKKYHYQKLSEISYALSEILKGLCIRDSRFAFLHSALQDFLDGPLGLNSENEAGQVHDLATQPPEPWSASNIPTELLAWHVTWVGTNGDKTNCLNLEVPVLEIIHTTIFELLEIFDIDVATEEAPINQGTITRFDLLKTLYETSKRLEPKSASESRRETKPVEQTGYTYQYYSALDSTADQIRVLEILPGTDDEPIACRLAIRSLFNDGTYEALSYVWGTDTFKKSILVDGKAFSIRRNLFHILQSLRKTDGIRSIWVDAICINQSDHEEKIHQIRLMRDIYSQADHTIIWLGGFRSDHNSAEEQKPDSASHRHRNRVPLPVGCRDIAIDENDLHALYAEFQKYPADRSWDEKQRALFVMLGRCISHLHAQEWWERIWTLQEAILPSRSPIMMFQGYSCLLDDIISASNIFLDRSPPEEKMMKHIASPQGQALNMADPIFTSRPWNYSVIQLSMLRRLRPNFKSSNEFEIKTLKNLLPITASYRASIPQDKIFALESFLPRYLGRLIKIDYEEGRTATFKRATARCYNESNSIELAEMFPFLFESSMLHGEPYDGPSWVLDFTYSDTLYYLTTIPKPEERMTLDKFVHKERDRESLVDYGTQESVLVAPKILFCTGCIIDQICVQHPIPDISSNSPIQDYTSFITGLRSIYQTVLTEALHNLGYAPERSDSDVELDKSLSRFFCLLEDEAQDLEDEPQDPTEDLIRARNPELAGKMLFFTKKGLMGIATMPVENDDCLTLVHGTRVYLLLREIKGQSTASDTSRKHRIVARAAVLKKLPGTKEVINAAPTQRLQII